MEYSPDNAIPYVSYVDAGTKELVERVTGAEIVSSADLVQLARPCSARTRSPATAAPRPSAWPSKTRPSR